MCASYDYTLQAEAQTQATRASYAAIAGAVLVTGGGVLWWMSRDRDARHDRTVQLMPSAGADHVAVFVSGAL